MKQKESSCKILTFRLTYFEYSLPQNLFNFVLVWLHFSIKRLRRQMVRWRPEQRVIVAYCIERLSIQERQNISSRRYRHLSFNSQ